MLGLSEKIFLCLSGAVHLKSACEISYKHDINPRNRRSFCIFFSENEINYRGGEK